MVQLRKLLEDNQNYFVKFNNITEKVTNVSGRINTFFPTYTNHDVQHVKYVEKYANMIIPDEIKEDLNIEEIFFLLCGIWLHDMGMLFKDDELLKYNEKSKDEKEKFTIAIRESHNIRSETYINEYSDELGLSWPEAKIIGQIAKGHRQIDLHDVDDDNYNGSNIRVSFLSAIVRLADECHVDESRESSLSKIGIDKKTIRDFYNSHEKIDQVIINHDDRNILISCKLENREDLKELNKIKSKIQKELDGIFDILGEFDINLKKVILKHYSPILIEKELILHLSEDNDDFMDFRIEGLENIEIDDRLNKLCSENMIKNIDSKFELNDSLDIFEKIFKKFEKYGDLDLLYFKKYSQDRISEIISKLNKKFNAIYLENSHSREVLLRNSPTAAKLAFNFEDIFEFPNFDINSNQNGKLIFDYLLLMSIFNDVKYYNNKINFDEVEEAIINLNHDDEDILSRIHQYRNFDENDFEIENGSNNENYPISFDLKLMSDGDEFSKILAAAFKSGNPVKFVGDRIIEFNITENGETKSYKPDALLIYPTNIFFDLKLGSCWYNNIEFKQQQINDKKIKFVSVSDKLDVNIMFAIDSNEEEPKLNLKILTKSNKIQDMFNFYLFTYQYSSGDFKIYRDDLLIFEEVFPDNGITSDFIVKYRKLNRINRKLNLNLTHDENYIITNDDFKWIDSIESRITNNIIKLLNLDIRRTCSVRDLQSVLEDENKKISIKLNVCINLLNQNIDLGMGNAIINSLCIENKEEIIKLIASQDINDEVDVELKITDNASEEILVKFEEI